MTPTTYQSLIRSYADMVRRGVSDTDLTPRQARLTAVVLATASNDNGAVVVYPPTDGTRDDVVRRLGNALWTGNARAFIDAASPRAGDDLAVAIERAVTILRGI